jgi:hypothetical protein
MAADAGPEKNTKQSDAKPPSDWGSDPNWWVAIFTGSLVLVTSFQVLLFIWQLRLIRKSADDSKLAAQAAERSATIATNMARAWIVTECKFADSLPDITGENKERKSRAVVFLRNAGKSPAEVDEMRMVSVVLPTEDGLNATPVYDQGEEFKVSAIEGEIIAPGRKLATICPLRNGEYLSDEQVGKIRSGEDTLYCYGRIIYRDNSGEKRTTQFGYYYYIRLDPSHDRPEGMYRLKNRKYNYTE